MPAQKTAIFLLHTHTLIEKKRGRCASCKWLNYSILTDGNPDENPGEKTAFACQGTRLHLKCLNASEVIKVTRANYGRFSIAVCNDKSMTTWSVNCFSAKAQEVFASKSVPFLPGLYFHGTFFNPGFLFCSCNNFAECHILAEDFDFGPNPCPDTERYLEASYVCVPRSQNYEGKIPLKKSFFVADAVREKRLT